MEAQRELAEIAIQEAQAEAYEVAENAKREAKKKEFEVRKQLVATNLAIKKSYTLSNCSEVSSRVYSRFINVDEQPPKEKVKNWIEQNDNMNPLTVNHSNIKCQNNEVSSNNNMMEEFVTKLSNKLNKAGNHYSKLDLPYFNGNIEDWPSFKAAFDRSN